jgi:glycosyltransferase involved in cell wall biosynthesis
MTHPRVSVALAAYNGARFIAEQLQSLASQTHLPYELVITDDGSTDATPQIIEQFARSAPFPVSYHRNEQRLQFADNFLRAASLCKGDLIAFCDQDDVWLPSKLARATEAFKDPEVQAFIHSAKVVDAGLKELGWRRPHYHSDGPGRWQPWGTFFGFAIVFRKALLDISVSDRPPGVHGNAKLAHDEWIIFLAEGLGSVYYCKEILALYRRARSNTKDLARLQDSARHSCSVSRKIQPCPRNINGDCTTTPCATRSKRKP